MLSWEVWVGVWVLWIVVSTASTRLASFQSFMVSLSDVDFSRWRVQRVLSACDPSSIHICWGALLKSFLPHCLFFSIIDRNSACKFDISLLQINEKYSFIPVCNLESNNILSSHQYGFWRNRITEVQLLSTYNDVGRWIDEGYVVNVILLDYSKAFDLVSHVVLLSKLEFLGVCNSLLAWISAFLSGSDERLCE